MQLNASPRVDERFWGVFAVFMKVLVAEDEPLIRLGMAMVIEEAGYQVVEVGNTDDALRAIEAEGDVGLLLTDVDMPGSMDGIRLAHVVRRRWPPAPHHVREADAIHRAGHINIRQQEPNIPLGFDGAQRVVRVPHLYYLVTCLLNDHRHPEADQRLIFGDQNLHEDSENAPKPLVNARGGVELHRS